MVYRILINTQVFEIEITASEFISTHHYDIAVGVEESFILTWPAKMFGGYIEKWVKINSEVASNLCASGFSRNM